MRLKELCGLRGVSGDEGAVRAFILKELEGLADEVTVDALGSVIALKRAKEGVKNPKRLMLAAHMDEIGFIVQYVRDDGLLRYEPVGGVNAAVCVSKRVEVGKSALPGVIGSKAIHLQEPAERTKPFTHDMLYVDIGAKDKKEALARVQPGDYISFMSDYVEFGEGMIKARALDDRAGCAILLELMKGRYDCELICAFTVQEEIGLNGATAAAHRTNPDYALAIETTTANDVPGAKAHEEVVKLKDGPALSFMDGASIANRPLFEALCGLATAKKIPFQLKRGTAGGNDAGAMQRARAGRPVAVISVPCRYIHSPACVCAQDDIENTLALCQALLDDFAQIQPKFAKED
ncbi:MAG: M42 family metallopeptidase [Christensenellaceae bacterium]|nr:M42 family metallopeptidase [Christensenellaceae bacterium]